MVCAGEYLKTLPEEEKSKNESTFIAVYDLPNYESDFTIKLKLALTKTKETSIKWSLPD
jgi:hypothetical protein